MYLNLVTIIYIPVIVAISLIATTTYFYQSKKYLRHFSYFTYLTAIWLLCQYLSQIIPAASETAGLHVIQLSSAIAYFIAYTFLMFVKSYTKDQDMVHWRPFIAVGILLTICNFTPLMIREVQASTSGIEVRDAGILYFIDLLLLGAYFVSGLVILIRATLRSRKADRSGNYYLITGLLTAIVPILLGSIFYADSAAAQIIFPVAVFAMVAIIAFGMFRHSLFEIRAIIARSLGYIVSLVALAAIYGFMAIGVAKTLFHTSIPFNLEIFLCATSAFASLAFPTIKKGFDKVTSRLFFRDAYDSQALYDQLNKILVASLDIRWILKECSSILVDTLKAEYCLFELRRNKDYRMLSAQANSFTLKSAERLHTLMADSKQTIIAADLLDGHQQALKNFLNENNISALVKLSLQTRGDDESLGYIVLGPKKSGDPYSSGDLRVLDTVAKELVIAIQNALHYEEIQNFNTTLQQKIEEATHKLRNANKRLTELDESKDDFISMASHQLRTPLTSVKGYLSMVLEEDAGKINEVQRKMLGQAFTSSQRMVYLIADLLNVSRLKTGKFIIEPAPINLSRLVSDEIDQLRETAGSRSLQLIYNPPADFPELMLDETKTRQVIMNFVDNAIYYTPAGGTITLELLDKTSTVELRVIDSGIGVPKRGQPHLFTKFYRAGNARKARPDGTGLGLFMAKKVIIAQGGAIIFQSSEGQGSVFGFTLSKTRLAVKPSSTAAPAISAPKPAKKPTKTPVAK